MSSRTQLAAIVPRSRLLLGVLALLLAVAESASAQSTGDHHYTSEQIEAGARVYTRDCQLCHGPNGEGSADGVNLRRGRFRLVRTDEDIRRLITNGSGDDEKMPGIDLSEEELDAIVAYIRAGFDKSGVAVKVGDPKRGRMLFTGKGKCASCHRVNGHGPRSAPDLSEIGAIRNPTALQRSILDPNAALLPIHRPVRAVTSDGETIFGRRLNEDTYTVQLIDSKERLRSLVKADLVEFEVSTKSNKEPTKLSGSEVADVIGYLVTLRGLE
jgi:putative heme-binding domain-containing protein